MRVLVTGGSGVIGEAAVHALVERGHGVRLLARHAREAVRRWPTGVEPWVGDVTEPETLRGAVDGCDAVLHLVGIVDEQPPDATFERVNVDGTRHLVAEAERAGAPRFVFVSSLGAERGESDYHRSKVAGERIVARYRGDWLVVRPGNVYGPGDEQVSMLLRMVRTLPVVPIVHGDRAFQPIWSEDAGRALAAAVERRDLAGRALDVAGAECTTGDALVERFQQLTGRTPPRVPLPGLVAGLGVRLADALGIPTPLNDSQLTMIAEGNVVEPPEANAIEMLLGGAPTSLDDGLRLLLDGLPEQLPTDGVGRLTRKRFWADVRGARIGTRELFARMCAHFQQLTPAHMDLEAEPDAPTTVLECGQTVTMSLPLRGNVQVRVAELDDTCLTLQTVEGHPLAGAVRFALDDAGDTLRIGIDVVDRAANFVDWLAMATVGDTLQNASWRELIENLVTESGGDAPAGVESDETHLEGDDARAVEEWLAALALERKRSV